MATTRAEVLAALPVTNGQITLRQWTREDTEARAHWPPYPEPYAGFGFTLAKATAAEREEHFLSRRRAPDRIDLAVDHTAQPAIGLIALIDVDWDGGVVGSMGLRFRPDWCGRGWGTAALRATADWAAAGALAALRLDVGAANRRAVRCYEKVGFRKVGEFWRDDPALRPADLSQPEYDDVRPYARVTDGTVQVQFWWMQLDLGGGGRSGVREDR